SGTDRYLIDADGQRLLVRNSNKSDFCDQTLPAGHGDVVGILSYYNGKWQFVFRTTADCIDFEGESYAPGGGEAVVTSLNQNFEGVSDISELANWATVNQMGAATWFTQTYSGNTFAACTGYNKQAGADGYTSWLVTPGLDVDNMTEKVFSFKSMVGYEGNGTLEVFAMNSADPTTAVLTQLSANIPSPTGSWSDWIASGNIDLSGFSGVVYIGFRYQAAVSEANKYTTYRVDDVVAGIKAEDVVTPPTPDPTGKGSADEPYTVAEVIAGASGSGVWVTGYIVGAINDKSISDAAFTAPFSLNSNILLAATPGETNVDNCIPVQLASGTDARTALNLVDHPDNLGKQVSIKGDLTAYFGKPGSKGSSAYAWGDKGSESTTPEPSGTAQFKKVTSITSGKQYLIVADGKMAKLDSRDYGYLQVDDVTDNGGTITADPANAYTFTAVSGGYNITMSNGKYVYQKGTYNSFNFDTSAIDGSLWTVAAQSDGTFKITNVNTSKWIQYDSTYTSYGCYDESKGSLPALYEKVN
ncbi:MAG: choice-of-anchor J domain-containing protein, partial [Paramuribaculum sp.]|nr:choice-of-anchor J domain-containing protein [Paramuribaculum sp.]